MEGLDLLKSSIYHERQQPGSMLCAQHALNNLLRMCPFIWFRENWVIKSFSRRGQPRAYLITLLIAVAFTRPDCSQFSAPDLSSIAADLDQLEESVDEDRRGHTSANMDDTGFFSVQVLENALKVWGFRCVDALGTHPTLTYQAQPSTMAK